MKFWRFIKRIVKAMNDADKHALENDPEAWRDWMYP
jgi:hypothetical protein